MDAKPFLKISSPDGRCRPCQVTIGDEPALGDHAIYDVELDLRPDGARATIEYGAYGNLKAPDVGGIIYEGPISLVVHDVGDTRSGDYRHSGYLRDLQGELNRWGERTFPDATDETIYAHLKAEIGELGSNIADWNDEIGREYVNKDDLESELADVLILALQLAGRYGIDADLAIHRKMEINRKRTWQYDAERGFSVHVEDVR